MLLGPLILLLSAAEPPAPAQSQEAVLSRLRRSLAGLEQPAPTPPPLVPAPDEQELEPEPESAEAEAEAPPEEVLAPTPPRLEVKEPRDDLRDESEQRGGPPSRVGMVAVAGGEGAFATNGTGGAWFRPRVGLGLRVALTAPEASVAVPSLALVGGYAGLLDHRVFAELRAELLVAHAGAGMLMPGFTLYALGGFDVLLAGGVDPYVGVGIGWDHNIFAKGSAGAGTAKKSGGGGGWGGGWGGLGSGGGGLAVIAAAVVAVAVAVGVVIGFVCAGRVEFRYHPASPRNAPPTASVLFGFGI
ncbi:MAG: hypothetical protein Q8L48_25175 [Archangium sp.]|nr:hypothetical protein [Archangium sp.]